MEDGAGEALAVVAEVEAEAVTREAVVGEEGRLEDEGGAVSAAEADSRRAALTPLDHAARRGLVAACSSVPGR